jgi:hypothetical protein
MKTWSGYVVGLDAKVFLDTGDYELVLPNGDAGQIYFDQSSGERVSFKGNGPPPGFSQGG